MNLDPSIANNEVCRSDAGWATLLTQFSLVLVSKFDQGGGLGNSLINPQPKYLSLLAEI